MPGRAGGGQEALLLAAVGEPAVDFELELGDRAGAAGDRGHGGDRVDPEVAPVDAGDLDRDDDRGRRRDGDVGVDEEDSGAVVDPAVEEDDRAPAPRTAPVRGRRLRRRRRRSRRSRPGRPSSRPRSAVASSWPSLQAGRPLAFRLNALVEVEVERSDRGRMGAVGGSDFRVDVGRDRRLAAPRQLRRRDAAVVFEEEVPGADDLRLGESGRPRRSARSRSRWPSRASGASPCHSDTVLDLGIDRRAYVGKSGPREFQCGDRVGRGAQRPAGVSSASSERATSRSAARDSRGRPRIRSTACNRLLSVRRLRPSAAAAEETLRPARK